MKTKSWPIILNFTYVYAFELCLKKFPIMLNMMPIATAIVPQFIYNFIIFNHQISIVGLQTVTL